MRAKYGAPEPGYIPWRPTEQEIKEIKAGGRITEAARWDCASPENRAKINPNFNSNKRWFEQKANTPVKFK